MGIITGVITGRSFGEALVYADALQCRGPIICEDGTVLVLPPNHSPDTHKIPAELQEKLVKHHNRWVLILSDTNTSELDKAVRAANDSLQQQSPGHPPMVSSTTLQGIYLEPDSSLRALKIAASDDFRTIKGLVGYESDSQLVEAAHRLATCFVATANYREFDQTGPADLQRKILRRVATEQGLEVISPKLPHLRGKGADKGAAIYTMNQYAHSFLGVQCSGILPICFGNNDNDVVMMKKIGSLDGLGVVVAHPDKSKGHYIKVQDVQAPHIYIAQNPYGLGMREGLEFIKTKLKTNHDVNL
jgi:hydroxymethylpyrimidine pyrophosphatase-like HAD family hydrolase